MQVEGATACPAHGRALLTANHAGILPWDATMISMALLREHPLPRYPRFLVLNWAFDLPWISAAMRKVGGVVASPFNALRLLEQDHLVAVFPEGVKGTGKPYSERYRVQRFGRGGFVEIALRSGAPIVPVAVVGSEEIYPKLAELPALARLIGAPYFPVTPTFPWLGPLGAVPLPSKWRIEFCPRSRQRATARRPPGTAERCSSWPNGPAKPCKTRSMRTWSVAARLSSEPKPADEVTGVNGVLQRLTSRPRPLRSNVMRPKRVLWPLLVALLAPSAAHAAPADPYVVYTANNYATGAVILRTDPAAGSLVEISRNGPQGTLFERPFDLALEADGDILVADMGAPCLVSRCDNDGRIIRVDPITGRQTLLAEGCPAARPGRDRRGP